MRRTTAALVCVAAMAATALVPAQVVRAVPVTGLSAVGAVASGTATTQGTWVRAALTRTQPERRFPITVTAPGRHVITLGGLTGAADLVLLDDAGRRLAGSARRGLAFERITRVLQPGSYEVVVRRSASSPMRVAFALRIDRMAPGMTVTSTRFRSWNRGTAVEMRFMLTNNTESAVQLGGVWVVFRDGAGRTIREIGSTCITRTYARQVLGPGESCVVEVEGNLARRAATRTVRAEVGTPAAAPRLRATGLRLSPAASTGCTGGRAGCVVLNRRVTNAGDGTARRILLETVRWDAYGRVRDVAWSWTQPRLLPGRSVVMPAYTYRGARPRDLTVVAVAGPWTS
jgi:hypothetical protein